MPSDPELLSRYLDHDDESAFTELVARYLPLVEGILRRRTGSTELAMQVFAALAVKAPDLKDRANVGGWLVITARQKGAEALRNDSTRKKYMEKLAAEPDTSPDQLELGAETSQHLDDALAALPDDDRQAVLLHYYENLPYHQVGQRLGRKEDAARKRVGRALEKLGNFLRRRGVALSSSALAGGLAAQLGSTSASAASAGAVSQQALSIAASSPAAIASAPVAKLALAATALFLASSATGYVAARAQSAKPEPDDPPVERPILTATQTRSDNPLNPDLAQAVAPYLRMPVPERIRAATELWENSRRNPGSGLAYIFSEVIENFRADECAEALDILDRDYAYNHERHWRIAYRLSEKLAEEDPPGTAAYAIEKIRGGNQFWAGHHRLGSAIEFWAKDSPKEAQEWLAAQELEPKTRELTIRHLIEGTSHSNPEIALAMVLAMPWEERKESLDLLRTPDAELLLSHAAMLPDETHRAELFNGNLINQFKQLDEMIDSFDRMGFTKSDAAVPVIDKVVDRQFKTNPAAALDFAWGNLPAAAHPHFLDHYVRKWLESDPASATTWLGANQLTEADVSAATASFRRR